MKNIYIVIIFVLFILILVSGACATVKENLSQMDESNAASLGLDTKFHDSIEDIKAQSNAYIPILNKVKVTNNEGEEVEINIPRNLGGFTYYEPGAYKYSSASYVPDYEDGVYLSKSIGAVPKYKTSDYLGSSMNELKSIDTPYNESDLIISRNPTASSIMPTEEPDNVKLAVTPRNKSQFKVTYPIDKTDEELEYENKVANLLNAQTNIRNYVTTQGPNVQKTIKRPILTAQRVAYAAPTKEGTTPLNEMQRLASLERITQRSKKKYAYDNEVGETMSRDDLLKYSDQ
jgi:hypothetical protein